MNATVYALAMQYLLCISVCVFYGDVHNFVLPFYKTCFIIVFVHLEKIRSVLQKILFESNMYNV